MGKFKKIMIPPQWKEYWTAYPHGYTILEALVDWLSEFNDIVENVNDWNKYLDDFVNTFDFELQEEVRKTIERWQSAGLLDEIIASALNTDLDKVKLEIAEMTINLKRYKKLVVNNDWSIALQKAISDLNGQGGTIFIPFGNYHFSTTIALSSNIKITGNKPNITTSQPVLFRGDKISNVTIDNLVIKGPGWAIMGTDSTQGAITITNGSNIVVTNTDISDFYTCVSIMYSDNVTVKDNHLYKYSVYGLLLSRTNKFIVTHNRIHDTMKKDGDGTYCISATGGGAQNWDTNHNIISNNILYNNEYWSAFMSHNINHLIISNNHIYNVRNGIDLSSGTEVRDVIVTGNYIEGTNTDVWKGSSAMNHGILIIGTGNAILNNVTISNNIVKNFGKFNCPQIASGIIVQNVDGCSIMGNVVYQGDGANTYKGAISISRNATNISVTGNTTKTINVNGITLFNIQGGNINVTGNTLDSGDRTPIRVVNSTINSINIENNTTTADVVYRGEGTNIINGLTLNYPYEGFATAKTQSVKVPAENITLEPGETKRLQIVELGSGSVTPHTMLFAHYSQANQYIDVIPVWSDTKRVSIYLRNNGSTTFVGNGGTVTLKTILT